MKLTTYVIALVLGLSVITDCISKPVQIQYENLLLNAELVEGDASTSRIFLIVHGTWAHGGMEITNQIQSLLKEAGEASLAITLSLGVNNRQGFMTCDAPIVARHGQGAQEINSWVQYLQRRWRDVVVIGHSRGGNQTVLYRQQYKNNNVPKLVLIAPMSWQRQAAAKNYAEKAGKDLKPLIKAAQIDPHGSMFGDVNKCRDIRVTNASFLSYYSDKPEKNTPILLQSIKLPTLVILGTDDVLSQNFHARIKGISLPNNINIRWIDGADHFFRDFYADELMELILEWL